jgi:TonB-linked SusC/RagA family outer membrane protein
MSAAADERPRPFSAFHFQPGGDVQQFRPLVGAVLIGVVWSATALAQRPLHGTVTDLDTGSPVGGARVRVKETGGGALTTPDGRFTLNVAEGALTLEVRRIGYEFASVPVAADQNDVQIKLRATAIQLGEQVVTGQTTTIARRNLANDVATVSAEDVSRVHSETIESALQGKVTGTVISANSGAPGGGLQVRMRGVTSIFGNSQPLYVIDGVPVSNTAVQNGLNAVTQSAGGLNSSNQDNPVNRIADLNPDDIESISMLKGPSAAAIYGSSAANGVVLITTRRGAPGQTRFSVTQRFGTHVLSNKIGAHHFTLSDAIAYNFDNFGIDTATTTAMYTRSGGFQDVEEQIYGDKSLSYETDLSVSGGGERTQFFFSGLDQHDNGIMYGTGYDKQSLRLNVTHLAGSKLQLRANFNAVHSLTKRGISNNDNINVTPYFVLPATPSFFDFQPDANGVYPRNPYLSQGTNPLQTLGGFSLPEDVYRIITSVDATYTVFSMPTQSLRATLNAGLDSYSYNANIYSDPRLYWESADGFPGTASELTTTEQTAPVAFTLTHTYNQTSNAVTATTSAGVRYGYRYLRSDNVVGQNLLAPGQQNPNLATNVVAFPNRERTRTLSLFGQEEVLLLDQRLFLSAGILAQKSTNNADVNKLFYYPKVAASYRWPSLGPFEEFKVRAAYGQTGNEPVYAQKFQCLTGLTYTGQNAVAIQAPCTVVPDPNLHPEREREIEGGVDATLLNSRVALSVTGYQKNITDLILQATLAPSTGWGTHVFNGGEIRNRGIEAALSGFPVRTKDLSWLARVTFTKNVGRVMSLPPELSSGFRPPNNFGFGFGSGFIKVGESPSQLYGFDTTTGVLHALGDLEPKFVMGFSSDVTVGNFHLYGLLDWRHGSSVVNVTQNGYDFAGTAPDSAESVERLNLFLAGRSPYIQDASFLKLREVTLSYQLPETVVRSVFGGRVTGVRAELSGRNLVTWSPYKGLDPEVSNFGNQNINRGQDLAPYPPSRSYFFSLAVDF